MCFTTWYRTYHIGCRSFLPALFLAVANRFDSATCSHLRQDYGAPSGIWICVTHLDTALAAAPEKGTANLDGCSRASERRHFVSDAPALPAPDVARGWRSPVWFAATADRSLGWLAVGSPRALRDVARPLEEEDERSPGCACMGRGCGTASCATSRCPGDIVPVQLPFFFFYTSAHLYRTRSERLLLVCVSIKPPSSLQPRRSRASIDWDYRRPPSLSLFPCPFCGSLPSFTRVAVPPVRTGRHSFEGSQFVWRRSSASLPSQRRTSEEVTRAPTTFRSRL